MILPCSKEEYVYGTWNAIFDRHMGQQISIQLNGLNRFCFRSNILCTVFICILMAILPQFSDWFAAWPSLTFRFTIAAGTIITPLPLANSLR